MSFVTYSTFALSACGVKFRFKVRRAPRDTGSSRARASRHCGIGKLLKKAQLGRELRRLVRLAAALTHGVRSLNLSPCEFLISDTDGLSVRSA